MVAVRTTIIWPDGTSTQAAAGCTWLQAAAAAGQEIPVACCKGSCGACEIEINGEVVRTCVSYVPQPGPDALIVKFTTDPYW